MPGKSGDNPFSLNFGKEPYRLISRDNQIDEVVETFNSATPTSALYIITGVRGSGKTVTMASILNRFKKDKDWITISLNPNRDLLTALAAALYEEPALKPAFIKAKISISFFVEASMKTEGPPADIEVQLRKMLKIVQSMDRKVLIAIDEASNTKNMRIFASSFQMFLYESYPLFLVMTGLYENIRSLQDEKNLTFLYRAPRIELKPLSVLAMANDYKKVLGINDQEAKEMARFTMGYSYAFQVLGYLRYKDDRPLPDLIPRFDEIMEEYSYEKIWSELSARDRDIVHLLAKNGKMKVEEILKETGMSSSSFSTYRRRLGKGGIISTEEYGYCDLCLPRFREIISAW
jgi:hypothetical protein